MSACPALTPVTRPVVLLTVATAVFEDNHEPPAVPLLVYVVVAPIQIVVVPLTVPAETFAETISDFIADAGDPHPELTV